MKKIFFLAAAAALTLASCAKESKNENGGSVEPVSAINGFTIRIAGSTLNNAATRSTNEVQVPATGSVTFSSGFVMVFDPAGAVKGTQAITSAGDVTNALSNTGVAITGSFATDNTVLVLGNLSAAQQTALAAATTLSDATKILADITTQTAFANVVLGNEDVNGNNKIDGDELAPLTLVSGTSYVARANVSPMVSRIEVLDIAADTAADKDGLVVMSFSVTGMFLDNFYDKFTLGAEFTTGSTMRKQADQATADNFTDLKNKFAMYADGAATGPTANVLAATETAGLSYANNGAKDAVYNSTSKKLTQNAIAKLGGTVDGVTYTNNSIFSYNVVPHGVPAIIVRVSNVATKNLSTGANSSIAGTSYLRISGYSLGGSPVEDVLRGVVYRLGGDNPIKFKPENVSSTPIVPEDKTLNVAVTTVDWKVEKPTVSVGR